MAQQVKSIDEVVPVAAVEGLARVGVHFTDLAGEKHELIMTHIDALILARRLAALNIS
jgi:hypothetical protein